MNRTFLGEIPIFLLLLIGNLAGKTFSNGVLLNNGSVFQVRLTDLHNSTPFIQRAAIASSSSATFNITNVSSSASFIIFQIHTYQYNVTLSFDKDHLNKVSNRSVFGTNIGLYSRQTTNITTQLFVKNDNVHEIEALLVAIAYNDKAPIPGGCNMEFNTEVAAYMDVHVRDVMVIVDMQPASIPLHGSSNSSCLKNPVEHRVYHMFLSEQDYSTESYFAAIENMLTVENIMENGVQVPRSTISSPMRNVFNAYTGVGSVYVAVATYGNHSAAYVPAFSYACSPIVDPDSCKLLLYSSWKFLCAFCLVLGLLTLYFGKYCLVINMALPVLFVGTVIGYTMGGIEIGIGIGICITIAWAVIQVFQILVGSILFNLTLGFLISSIVYYCLSDSAAILQNDFVFWTLFATLSISTALVTICLLIFINVIICAIFTSFMVILPLDYYLGSSLKYIVINIARRATVSGFNVAINRPPFQPTDIFLVVLWCILAFYRFFKQWLSYSYI